MIKILAGIFLLSFISCTKSQSADEVSDKDKIRQEMKDLIVSYGQAVENMDVEGTISHFSNDTEFYIHSEGTHYTYDKIKAAVQTEFFKGLKSIEIKWDTMHVQVLDEKKASCFAILNQTLLDSAENTFKVRVEATFIGVKKENTWKIVYVHSKHEPI